jgi:tetratricopeptide (TPR) repeat protein
MPDQITIPDIHHLRAAIGWYELGNFKEARGELSRLNPTLQEQPDILEVRWAVEAGEEDWASAMKTARELTVRAPEKPAGWLHLAYAVRRVLKDGLTAAWEVLRPAADRFPQEFTIAYNLACYACQLGRMDEARKWLATALNLGEKETIQSMALADADLEPLRPEISAW